MKTNFKQPKKKLCKNCNKLAKITSRTLCFTCLRNQQKQKRQEKLAKKLERKVKSKKFQLSELKRLHKKCWEVQKQFLRKRWANFQDQVECFTCYKLIPVKEIHVGHFWHGKLDFDPRNLKPQCAGCNMFGEGRLAQYSARLIREHGQEWFLELDHDAHTLKGYTLEDLKQVFEKYTQLLSQL